MSEELVIDNQPTITNEFDSFDGSPAPIEEKGTPPTENNVEPPKADTTPVIEPPVEDGRNFLKEKLGYEDWDAIKTEIETLKAKVENTTELKYEALEPTKIKELYAIIDKKEKLDQLIVGEITKDNAGAIIKAAMTEKYKGLSPEMVTHKFNKSFAIPPKPVEDNFIDTTEFEIAQNEWNSKVADIEMEMLIEANLVRPELEKLNTEIKLPELTKTDQEYSLTPEELAKEQQEMEMFLTKAGEAINKFEGFNVTYKNNDVDVQSTYALSDEEKTSVLGKIKLLAEKNYNSNAVFAERWVNSDMTFNYSQIAKDLAILETADKSSQKFVSDTAAKVKEQYLRAKHNTDLGKPAGGDLQLEDKTTQQKIEEAIWS